MHGPAVATALCMHAFAHAHDTVMTTRLNAKQGLGAWLAAKELRTQTWTQPMWTAGINPCTYACPHMHVRMSTHAFPHTHWCLPRPRVHAA